MIKGKEGEKNNLNNDEPQINRGVELLLRNRREKTDPLKTFQVKFDQTVTLFGREFIFYLNTYLDIKKK